MPQIQYFRDFIFENDLSFKFYGYHTYLIYHVVAACNMAKDLGKDITSDITYYFKRCLKFNILKLSPDISESTIVAIENEVKAVICSNKSSTTSETAPARAWLYHVYSSCSPINAYQIQQRNFEDEIFADDKLTAKTAKITSLENLYVYGTSSKHLLKWLLYKSVYALGGSYRRQGESHCRSCDLKVGIGKEGHCFYHLTMMTSRS